MRYTLLPLLASFTLAVPVPNTPIQLVTEPTRTGNSSYFTPDNSIGSCGNVISPGDYVVSLSPELYNTDSTSEISSQCGRTVLVMYQGKMVLATVQDMCLQCEDNGIELSSSAFKAIASLESEEVEVEWTMYGQGDGPAPYRAMI